jgi:hypothetical protein
MLRRILCYFCESLITPEEGVHCPYCGGSLTLSIDREWQRRNMQDKYRETWPKIDWDNWDASNCYFAPYFEDGGKLP